MVTLASLGVGGVHQLPHIISHYVAMGNGNLVVCHAPLCIGCQAGTAMPLWLKLPLPC